MTKELVDILAGVGVVVTLVGTAYAMSKVNFHGVVGSIVSNFMGWLVAFEAVFAVIFMLAILHRYGY